ncbi:MAG: diadenylate cyclase CdaA [Candidatus Cryptobacteroides sp.]
MTVFDFLHFTFADLLDILMVAVLIYLVFKWIRGTAAMNIFMAIMSVFILKVLVAALNMNLTNALLSTFIDVGVLALIILFQPELRHWLMKFGARYADMTGKGKSLLDKILGIKEKKMGGDSLNEVAEACKMMAEQKTGALIVISRKNSLNYVIETGDAVDARISRRLIMNLFFKNSPLHDGAMIIEGDRIVAARCTLPITSRTDIPASLGMRHRAAVGISEETDADVIVVSEETGGISFIREGNISRIGNINELKLLLGAGENLAEDK